MKSVFSTEFHFRVFAKQSKAKQSKAKQSKAKQSKAKQSKVKQGKVKNCKMLFPYFATLALEGRLKRRFSELQRIDENDLFGILIQNGDNL